MKGITSVFGEQAGRVKFLLLFFMVVFHIFFVYTLLNKPVILRDSEEYIHSSNNFEKQGNFYAGSLEEPLDYRLFSKRTPFYPLLLWVMRKFHIPGYLFLLQAFIGLLNVLLGFYLLRKIIPGKKLPLIIFSAFILTTPAQFIYSQLVMSDLWLQLFVMIGLLVLLRYLEKSHPLDMAILIICSVIAALIKPVMLPASLLISVFCIYRMIKQKHSKWYFIFILLPWVNWYALSKRNEKLTGVFHYSSIGYINLLHYNTNIYLNRSLGASKADSLLSPLMIRPGSKTEFIRNYKDVNQTCRKLLLQHAVGYGIYHLSGMILMYADPGRFDLFNYFRLEKEDSKGFLHQNSGVSKFRTVMLEYPFMGYLLILLLFVNLIKLIGFCAFLVIHRNKGYIWPGAIIVFYLALLTGPLGASRFALPAELILCAYAAAFFISLVKEHKGRIAGLSANQD